MVNAVSKDFVLRHINGQKTEIIGITEGESIKILPRQEKLAH